MVRVAAALLLALALGAASVQAQTTKQTDVAGALKKDNPIGLQLLEIAGVAKPASKPKARFTFLLPTDAALKAFLKDMGLTMDDLKKRPVLARHLVRQHLLLNSNVREQEIFDKGNTRGAASAASISGKNDLVFSRTAPGKVTVTDAQGNVAKVVGKPVFLDDNKTVHMIDRVLMGDDYYTSIDAACKHRAPKISSFCDAIKSTGLAPSLAGLDATVFVPNNAGFTKATAGTKLSKEQLTDVLKFHVVPGARELPRGWKGGEALPTLLKGQDLKMAYTRVKANGKRRFDWAEATVSPAAGGAGTPVLKANVHVGKTIVQGIGAVLLPGGAAPAKAAVATEAAKKMTPAAAAAPAKASSGAGRKLLDFQWGMMGGPTAEMDDATSDIAAAVNGDESVAAAADQSTLGAEELSVPGDYNQVVNGVNPW